MNRQKRITLKDFARVTGVSVSAISRILNDKATYCSEQKRQEVLDLAKEWNYKPNIGYRIMTGMPTNITAIIFSQERVTYSECNLRLLVELIEHLEERGYATYSTVMTPDEEKNFEKFLELERKGCRSFVLVGQPVGFEGIVSYIKAHNYCYIGMNMTYHNNPDLLQKTCEKSFFLDETAAIFSYLEILRLRDKNNYRLLMPKAYFESRLLPRLSKQGEIQTMRQRLVDIPSCEFTGSDGFDARYDHAWAAAREESQKDANIQGVICITDYHALGAAHYFHDIGRKVGEEVLVCGMFNTVAARFSLLPIITSHYDLHNLASQMLDHLFLPQPVQESVSPEIIIQGRMKK